MASPGDRVGIQAEELSQNGVAAVAEFDGLQTGEETTLLLVEQTVEEHDGRFEFIGRNLEGGGIDPQRNRRSGLADAQLLAGHSGVGGSIEESSGALGTAQAAVLNKVVEGILHFGVKHAGQFGGEATARGLMDHPLDRGPQRAKAGKPDGVV